MILRDLETDRIFEVISLSAGDSAESTVLSLSERVAALEASILVLQEKVSALEGN